MLWMSGWSDKHFCVYGTDKETNEHTHHRIMYVLP